VDEKEFQEVTGIHGEMIAANRTEGDLVIWEWSDDSASATTAYDYAVVPVNIFRSDLPRRTAAEYRPKK
jgi:hypothetical protein